MQNRKQRESLRMTRTYFLAGMCIRRERENPSLFPPEAPGLWPSTGIELLSPTMLESEGEKSGLDEGESAWLESGVFGWSISHSSTATQVWVVLTSRCSPPLHSGWQGPFRIGKLLDLKEFSGSVYWSWSSRISRHSDKSLPVSSWSDEVMVKLVSRVSRWLVPGEDTKAEMLQGWVQEHRPPWLKDLGGTTAFGYVHVLFSIYVLTAALVCHRVSLSQHSIRDIFSSKATTAQ